MADGYLKYEPVLVPVYIDGEWVGSYWHYVPVSPQPEHQEKS